MREQIADLLDRMDRQIERSGQRLIASAAVERVTGDYLTSSREAIVRSLRQIARTKTQLRSSVP